MLDCITFCTLYCPFLICKFMSYEASPLMASSHRRHRQDKTVLSYLVGGGTEFAAVADSFQYIGDRTVSSSLVCRVNAFVN